MQLVWIGTELGGAGSEEFDLDQIELEHGSEAPLLCLSAVEAVPEGVVCAQAIGIVCPPYAIVHRTYQLDAAVLEVLPPDPGEEDSDPAPPGQAPGQGQVSPSPPTKPCPVKKRGHRHVKKKKVGLGSNVKASSKGKRVRRCKTG